MSRGKKPVVARKTVEIASLLLALIMGATLRTIAMFSNKKKPAKIRGQNINHVTCDERWEGVGCNPLS